jgi:hypothetical protein
VLLSANRIPARKGGEHEALDLRAADSVRLDHEVELTPAGSGFSAPPPVGQVGLSGRAQWRVGEGHRRGEKK